MTVPTAASLPVAIPTGDGDAEGRAEPGAVAKEPGFILLRLNKCPSPGAGGRGALGTPGDPGEDTGATRTPGSPPPPGIYIYIHIYSCSGPRHPPKHPHPWVLPHPHTGFRVKRGISGSVGAPPPPPAATASGLGADRGRGCGGGQPRVGEQGCGGGPPTTPPPLSRRYR